VHISFFSDFIPIPITLPLSFDFPAFNPLALYHNISTITSA
jgi:hypothetical protein